MRYCCIIDGGDTMQHMKLLEKTYELIDAIKNDETYKTYLQLQKALQEDSSFKDCLKQFQQHKEQFEEASKYGTYYPDYEKIKNNYQTIKVNLMNHPLFKHYKQVEKKLEVMVYTIEKGLMDVVGIQDKHKKSSLKYMV
jgi:cell fate (sporulation/competence/biofilm development) regulator YlbF (YheA/YmcA/DUF963 family)